MRVMLSISVATVLTLSANCLGRELSPQVTVEGAPTDAIADQLRALATVDSGKTYTSLTPARRVAKRDAETMRQALIAAGYYAASVEPDLTRQDDAIKTRFTVGAGPRFTIKAYRIDYTDSQTADRPKTFSAIGAKTNNEATGAALKQLQDALIDYLRNHGFPEAMASSRTVDADFSSHTGVARFQVTSGPHAAYGPVEISGNKKTGTNYIRAYRPYQDGAEISAKELAAYQTTLSKTGLFNSVSVAAGVPDPDGIAPVLVSVSESKRRTVGAGTSFSTDIGVGVTAFWEDRNFRGKGDKVRAEVDVADLKQSVGLGYEKPIPRLPGQWGVDTLFQNENTDAYTAQTIKLGGGLTRKANRDGLELSAKAQYSFSTITDADGLKQNFSSAAFPLLAVYNTENDALNPTAGHRARLAITPFLGTVSFTQGEISGASRRSFGDKERFLIAGRIRLGASIGVSGANIPATERFFAGGGGSVRGYGYQLAGPLNDSGTPIGGASLAEINTEARYQVRESLQLAAFVDAGSVFDNSTPSFSGDIPVGAGVGVRYFTPVGPIRVDVATPLNPRTITEVVDGETVTRFQDQSLFVYIALGQAF
ncbi:MAG: autotransporter assembly complex protein TamA [Parvularcula sp.]